MVLEDDTLLDVPGTFLDSSSLELAGVESTKRPLNAIEAMDTDGASRPGKRGPGGPAPPSPAGGGLPEGLEQLLDNVVRRAMKEEMQEVRR